jgi:hypothetical protein
LKFEYFSITDVDSLFRPPDSGPGSDRHPAVFNPLVRPRAPTVSGVGLIELAQYISVYIV